ncbi:hypothetical protein [Actinoplanes sp. NPDC020271]|uniref:hypothetical protein n=1 Tax=Actinoplanes sp. NPDC020271 TaxID=3363896 RepID=UPI0037ADA4B0
MTEPVTGNTPQQGEQPAQTPAGHPWAQAEKDPTWWQGDTERLPSSQEWADLAAERARTAGATDTAEHLATADQLMIIEPGLPGDKESGDVPGKPDRPTVALDTGRAPRGPLPPLPEDASPATAHRLERVENSPFWETDEARIAAEARNDPRPGRRRRLPAVNPVASLLALIALSLVAAFFAWVSAEPFWLATGHGDRGYATTTRCHGTGLTQRCTGRFSTEDGSVTVRRVRLLGITGTAREPGAVTAARMVSPAGSQAYATPAGPLLHLRWALGFLMVLICGYGIAGATGARRLESARARRGALLGSVAGPVLLLIGFLIAAY